MNGDNEHHGLEQYTREATEVTSDGESVNMKFRPAPDNPSKIKQELLNVEEVGLVMESLSKENGVLQYQVIAVFKEQYKKQQ